MRACKIPSSPPQRDLEFNDKVGELAYRFWTAWEDTFAPVGFEASIGQFEDRGGPKALQGVLKRVRRERLARWRIFMVWLHMDPDRASVTAPNGQHLSIFQTLQNWEYEGERLPRWVSDGVRLDDKLQIAADGSLDVGRAHWHRGDAPHWIRSAQEAVNVLNQGARVVTAETSRSPNFSSVKLSDEGKSPYLGSTRRTLAPEGGGDRIQFDIQKRLVILDGTEFPMKSSGAVAFAKKVHDARGGWMASPVGTKGGRLIKQLPREISRFIESQLGAGGGFRFTIC